MARKLFSIFAALLFTVGAVSTAQSALVDLGVPIDPHGYPVWYEDANGLQLELCVPPPAGNASRPELCIGDPLELDAEGNPINPLVLTGESFWWLAEASIDLANGGSADLTLGLEATFGGSEEPIDGQQISFGRTRIRIDTPVAGTYTVTHPYGVHEFEVTPETLADGINYTADIGGANFLAPASGFSGALTAFGPDPVGFLTWPDYATNPDLQVLEIDPETQEPTGLILEQYIGDPNIASVLTDGTDRPIIFRVDGPEGSNLDGAGNNFVETDLFFAMGKVFDATIPFVAHAFPGIPPQNLLAVGPINRVEFFTDPDPAAPLVEVTGEDFNYAVGYPLWYQENLGTLEAPVPGLQLTLCTPGDAMCISDPIDPTDEIQTTLRTGGESFWWSADAGFDVGEDRYLLVLGIEGTFGGDESVIDGGQITFGRERIRFDFDNDLPAGTHTYRVTHPYGVRILEMAASEGRRDRIRFTADIGIDDPADPDSAHVGTLYSTIGPTFLTWDTFNPDPALTDPLLITPDGNDPALSNYYVGHPAFDHQVVGSPFGTNFFRVERLTSGTVEDGSWELVGETNLFAVSGKVFDDATFQFGAVAVDPNAPAANPDAAALDIALASSVTIDVLANDIFATTAAVSVNTPPANGTVEINGDGTVTYTPSTELGDTGGSDTFSYSIVDATGLTSNITLVTVTVVPVGGQAAPVAVSDSATLDMALASSVTIDVLANDVHAPPTTVAISAPPANGTAVASNPAGTVTYTPSADLAASGGVDTFAYNVVDSTGLTSNNAFVTVTVAPAPLVEAITVDRARFRLNNLRLDLRGTSNFEGSTLTIHAGTTAEGTVLGSAVVRNGRWSFRGTGTTNLTEVTVVSNSAQATTVTQTLQVR